MRKLVGSNLNYWLFQLDTLTESVLKEQKQDMSLTEFATLIEGLKKGDTLDAIREEAQELRCASKGCLAEGEQPLLPPEKDHSLT